MELPEDLDLAVLSLQGLSVGYGESLTLVAALTWLAARALRARGRTST